MADDSGEATARMILVTRIGSLEFQLKERMTPLLKKEMRHIIETHSETLKLPTFVGHIDLLRNLDNLHERFREHWEKVYKAYHSYTLLVLSMVQVEHSLLQSFKEDYLRLPPSANDWLDGAVPLITAHRAGKTDDDGKKYFEDVVIPLQEMGVDVGYVENKALLNAAGKLEKRRDGYVMHLVQTRDWQKLAKTLVKDRQLAADFFDHESFDSDSCNANTLKRVYERMDMLEHAYFESLSGPADFKLSKHALEVSAGKVEVVYSDGTPAVLYQDEAPASIENAKSPTRIPGMGHARSIFSAVAGSIKALKTSPTTGFRANPVALGKRHDEKAALVDSKEA